MIYGTGNNLILVFTLLLVIANAASTNRQPFEIVHPIEDHTKLELGKDGLEVLRSIKGLVAPVVVIGPYRSGKSFTLNQLLEVDCTEGFGVGHARVTQTKGIWMWGSPVPIKNSNGEEINLLFFDTEGFESAGKADVYDDRIFALSTLISSVLIYNLPETIRESDLEKLSFATELAKAFYSMETPTSQQQQQQQIENFDPLPPISPGSMVWLIQRDFLQGSTLSSTLKNALRLVPNPHNDPGIAQLNRIRQGLGSIASNSTALGLPQPHINRTSLCDIPDSELDRVYVQRREQLKKIVREAAQPKRVKGAPLDGRGLADLITDVVKALNSKQIPTSGSLVEYFNRELVNSCRDVYVKMIERQTLPVDNSTLDIVSRNAKEFVAKKFEKERFGIATQELYSTLDSSLTREYNARANENAYKSAAACEKAEMKCENDLEHAARRLPSTGRFEEHYAACRAEFDAACVGPSHDHYVERLEKAWDRERSRFLKEYHERLLNGLIILSLAAIILFRCVFKLTVGESVGWLVFLFLQIYPKTFLGSSTTMFETVWWQYIVQCWEFVVDNPLVDFDTYGLPMIGVVVVLYLTRKRWLWRVRCSGRKKSVPDGKDLDV